MSWFFELLAQFFTEVFNLLNIISFEMGGVQVTYGQMLIAMIILLMIISVFWRGAKA